MNEEVRAFSNNDPRKEIVLFVGLVDGRYVIKEVHDVDKGEDWLLDTMELDQ